MPDLDQIKQGEQAVAETHEFFASDVVPHFA